MSISDDTLRMIGASEDSARLPEESGGGYMGSLEVFHQLHCVVSTTHIYSIFCFVTSDNLQNLLWQATNAEYYKDKSLAWTDSAATLRQHLGGKTCSPSATAVKFSLFTLNE